VRDCVQVHLGAGIGNIVLATPLLVGLHELGFLTDVVLAADYGDTADLLCRWSAVRETFLHTKPFPSAQHYSWVIPAIPPFYWARYAACFANTRNLVARPPDTLFYQNEQEYYWNFAQRLGCQSVQHPWCTLPITRSEPFGCHRQTLVLAPGCKTGEMTAKRWPHYSELAERFGDVAVVGTSDDLCQFDGKSMGFSPHVKSFVDRLTLRETAEVIAAAGAFVGNDSGLSHIAAAVGTPTVMIFGPTPDRTLGRFPPNVRVLRRGSSCEPCWFNSRFRACTGRIDCLNELPVDVVVSLLDELGFVADYPRADSVPPAPQRSCLHPRGPSPALRP
jgi:Glycosyltransferase family 9 (heptosyltransferase)